MYSPRLRLYLPNLIITIITVFVIMASILINFAAEFFLNKETYSNVITEQSVDKIVYEEINQYFDRQSDYTGIDSNVFKSVIKSSDISSTIISYTDATIDYMNNVTNKKPTIVYDYTAIETALNNDYARWAKENNKIIDENAKKNIDYTLSHIKDTLDAKFDVMMFTYVNNFGISDFVHNHYDMLKIARIILTSFAAVLILILFLINRKHINCGFYWVGCSSLISGIIFCIPAIYLKASRYFDGLILKNDAIYKSLTELMYSFVNKVLIFGIILLVAGAILFLIDFLMCKISQREDNRPVYMD